MNAEAGGGIIRCAIYTRKSTEHGLEAEVNSLEMQRDVCRAYIKCQAHKNWAEVPQEYDDGGYSGAQLERPAFQRLLADVEAGRIDIVVIYKIDRLTRSLTDFVRIIDVLNNHSASFVSVTQTFDTSDSMGRLVLNILLTFAQFERELMSERVKDKKAAMRRRGIFTGGLPPMGYRIEHGHMVVEPERAAWVREMFELYPSMRTSELARELARRGYLTQRWVSKGGKVHGGQPITTATVDHVLRNPIYTGHIIHRGEWIKAQCEPLVSREQWDLVQEIRQGRRPNIKDPNKNFLLGILHDSHGRRMRIHGCALGHAKGNRYYRSERATWNRNSHVRRVFVEGDRVEALTKSVICDLFTDRVEIRKAVLSLGLYSDQIRRLLARGQIAARRFQLMDNVQLRHAILALVPRAEVTRNELRLYLSCHELSRFLAWDGVGLFGKDQAISPRRAERVHVIRAAAFLICGHPYYALPIRPCAAENTLAADEKLLDLLNRAVEFRALVLANRAKSVRQLAKEVGVGPNYFARVLRVNYLAPDIQTAIMDGRQPPGLTPHKILYGSLPLHWGQQRHLLGFGSANTF